MVTGEINIKLMHSPFLHEFSEFWMQISLTKVMTYLLNNVFWT